MQFEWAVNKTISDKYFSLDLLLFLLKVGAVDTDNGETLLKDIEFENIPETSKKGGTIQKERPSEPISIQEHQKLRNAP